MSLLEENINSIPSPCYVMEEDLLRRNLSLIKSVAERADVEIILAFKAFALWKSFPIFREYIEHTTASSPYEARLAFEEFGSPAHTYLPAYEEDTFPEILRCSSHTAKTQRNQSNQRQKLYHSVLFMRLLNVESICAQSYEHLFKTPNETISFFENVTILHYII